jgi:hypothetical protein
MPRAIHISADYKWLFLQSSRADSVGMVGRDLWDVGRCDGPQARRIHSCHVRTIAVRKRRFAGPSAGTQSMEVSVAAHDPIQSNRIHDLARACQTAGPFSGSEAPVRGTILDRKKSIMTRTLVGRYVLVG